MNKIKDKRVEKMLKKKGIVHAIVFYSPISFWIISLLMTIVSGAGLFYEIIASKYTYLLALYLILSYLISAYLNNSFALTNDELIVINPNFPFRKFKKYNRQEIKKITIDKNKRPWFIFFAIFGKNYVTIETVKNLCFKHYCISLEEDGYDEIWTEESIDSFHINLKDKGYSVAFNIDN